ncbi:FIST N-terminal domain-containing protein [Sorangium sp. So ce375]|uniref:FIST N-terminal domain-containing protein n=1 Tax=Sorangium sp. So ce375 TaxID=3133306 RepID=UPI003F5BBE54
MILETFHYDRDTKKWSVRALPVLDSERTLVLAFGAPELLDDPGAIRELRRAYPRSHVLGCSSAGEIAGTSVRDGTLTVAVARFERTTLATAQVEVASASASFAAGQALARKLERPGLRGVLVLSEGLGVNGSQLVRGMNAVLPESVVVTGGLSGDGTHFKRTWVCAGDVVRSGLVAAVGLYGEHVVIQHGSKGGWDKFGPERVVTRSEGNVLYEVDGRPALALYKEYLGEKAAELPASALLFPLAVRATAHDEKALVRTVLAVDHEAQSLTFAGDVPRGHLVQLMKADFERLIGGAEQAARAASEAGKSGGDSALAIAISCVGRRIVLGDRTEEEVEAVLDVLPKGTQVTGFYSYGEISPYATGHCDLHNQTMTLTVLSEAPTPLSRREGPGERRPRAAKRAPAAVAARVVAQPAGGMAEFEELEIASDSTFTSEAAFDPPSPASSATPGPLSPARAGEEARPTIRVPPQNGRRASRPHIAEPASGPVSSGHSPTTVDRPPPAAWAHRAAPTRSVPPAGAAGRLDSLAFDRRTVGDVLVVRLAGRMTEAFKGAALARELEGKVLLDLAGVERITSFGVREWLQMIQAAQPRLRALYLARCSEPVINQLSMIRRFAGNGRVVSFYAPYCCESCGAQFERLVDCAHDAAPLAEGKAPDAVCPRCDGPGAFDDDAETYFGFVAQHGAGAIPPEVREILLELERADEPAVGDVVEKSVEGRVTRLKVASKLTATLRWSRIIDGLEGQVVFDLSSVPAVTADGAARFESALRKLDGAVEAVRIEGCPRLLAERTAGPSWPELARIGSAVVEGRCASCSATRPVLVEVDRHAALFRGGQDPSVTCKRCNTPLAFDGSRSLLYLLGAHAARAPSAPPPVSAQQEPAAAAPQAQQRGEGGAAPQRHGGGGNAAFLALLGGVALAAAGFAAWRGGFGSAAAPAASAAAAAPAAAAASAAPAASAAAAISTEAGASAAPAGEARAPGPSGSGLGAAGWSAADDLPPAWVERPFVIEGESVLVVGRGGPAASEAGALAAARNGAIERLASGLAAEIAGSPAALLLAAQPPAEAGPEPRAEVVERIAGRFLAQVGSFATPERVDAVVRREGDGVLAFARYRLPRQSFDAAAALYRQTATFQGLTVARFFPQLEARVRTSGDLVVVAAERPQRGADPGVAAGDIVLSVGDRPVHSVEVFGKAAADAWARTAPGDTLTLQIESRGQRRSVSFAKSQSEVPR